MILSSNRVPGQLLPVGARYWYNAGAPLNVSRATSGLGAVDAQVGTLLGALVAGASGYYVAKKLAPKDQKGAGLVGAVTGAVLGAPGLALTAFIFAKK